MAFRLHGMCGIAAVWYADPAGGPLGADLSRMLARLAHRGHDGSGVGLASPEGLVEVHKTAEGPAQLAAEHALETRTGSHGVGHVRMATETAVDAARAHPFTAPGHPEVCVVHNGHVTNAEQLRFALERRGVHFSTDNDSEVIAAYIDAGLNDGHALEDILRRSIDELDGTFSYVVMTPEALGVARDRFAAKSLMVAETPEWIAICSEGRGLPGTGWRRREVGAGEVRTWRR